MSFEGNTASDLLRVILRAFSSFCKDFSKRRLSAKEKAQGARCQDELERLFLWANAVSIHNGYLDETLSRSSALRSSVLLILVELGNTVCKDLFKSLAPDGDYAVDFQDQRKAVADLQRKALESLQEDSQNSVFAVIDPYDSETSETGLDDVLENITTFNDCLMDLSLALERPTTHFDKRHLGARVLEETFSVSQPALVYCRKIRDQFPRLPVYLVERLGNANLQRANLLRDKMELTQVHKEGSPVFDASCDKTIRQIADTMKLSVSLESMFRMGDNKRQPDADSETSSDAKLASFSTSTSLVNQDRPRVPPIPQQAETGRAFKCEYCAQTMKGMTRQQWK